MDLGYKMFDHWLAMDAGSYSIKLYDYSSKKESEIRNVVAVEKNEVIAVGRAAFEYIYGDQRRVQVKYPLECGHVITDFSKVLEEGIDLLKSRSIFKPSMMVVLPSEILENDVDLWQKNMSIAGIQKMKFVRVMDVLQTEEPCFIIHAGHSYTELGIYARGCEFVHKTIHFAGKQVDEEIQKIVAQKTRCLITQEDACHLKEEASDLFWKKRNKKIGCVGMDRFQKYVRVEIDAIELWSAMKPIFQQIALWAKQVFLNVGMEMKEQILRDGVLLSGGLASCFGLRQMIEQSIGCPIVCTKEPKYDMIDALKEWR